MERTAKKCLEQVAKAWKLEEESCAQWLEWAARMAPEKRTETIVSVAADLKSRGRAEAMPRLAAAAGLTEVEFAARVAKSPMWR